MDEIENSDITSEAEKRSILETAYLLSIPGMREILDEGVELTAEDCEDFDFSEEILADLINQGYAGEKLLSEFKKVTPQVRPAIEKIIEEADALAKASVENYTDPTDEIFCNEVTPGLKLEVINELLMKDAEFKAEYEKLKTQYEVISKTVFPVIFTHADDGILVEVPDLEIFTEGDNMHDAIAMARDAIELKISWIHDDNQEIPTPSKLNQIDAATGTFAAYGESIVSLVDVEIVYKKGAADNA